MTSKIDPAITEKSRMTAKMLMRLLAELSMNKKGHSRQAGYNK